MVIKVRVDGASTHYHFHLEAGEWNDGDTCLSSPALKYRSVQLYGLK